MDYDSAVFLSRFGLGARAGEVSPANPRAWALDQLRGPDPLALGDCTSSNNHLAITEEFQRTSNKIKQETGSAPPNPANMIFKEATFDFCQNALTTAMPFRERLVWFWANHFNVSRVGPQTTACVHDYVREAIRPHVTGRFADMLLAVMRHPAMLNYLNQNQSVGPNSFAGLKQQKGLNENLARECLELHTVGTAAGYTQADVTSFAAILTGWTYNADDARPPLGFQFNRRRHEPGSKSVLGVTWPEGEEGGVMILNYLAAHPATYRHLAQKLVRHFAADDPMPDDVRRIETVLGHSNGDLGLAAASLLDLPASRQPFCKLRTPQDYVVACLRAGGGDPNNDAHLMEGGLNYLAQPLFKAPFPIGWPDRAGDWGSSEAMLARAEFAMRLADRHKQQDPTDLATAALGPLLSRQTQFAVQHAGSRHDGFALLFTSPEFQRR